MESGVYGDGMTNPLGPSHDLATATRLTADARRRYALPRWYAVASTTAFVGGLALLAVGTAVGWFLPALAVAVLTANAASFPLLLASWRAGGVVPRAGRLARSRYWRAAPVLILAALLLTPVAALLRTEVGGAAWLAVAVPFAVEHLLRLRAWARR